MKLSTFYDEIQDILYEMPESFDWGLTNQEMLLIVMTKIIHRSTLYICIFTASDTHEAAEK